MRKLLPFIVLSLSSSFAVVFPTDSTIDWDYAGIPGGIPDTSGWTVRNVVTDDGAVGDGVADDTAAIQAAIDWAEANGPQVRIYFPAGTYKTTSTLTIEGNSIVLYGAGESATTINASTLTTGAIIKFNRPTSEGAFVSISSGATKGSTSITISDASSFTIGDACYVTCDNDAALVNADGKTYQGANSPQDGGRLLAQVNYVSNKVGNVITLRNPLHWDFQSETSPVARYQKYYEFGGIELMTVQGGSTRAGGVGQIQWVAQDRGWARNVTSKNCSARAHFDFGKSLNCEVRTCIADRDGGVVTSGRNYGFFAFNLCSNILFEDNIGIQLRHSFISEGSVSGCVWSYGYSVDGVQHSSPGVDGDWLTQSLNTHGAHSFMNLFEGNIAEKISADFSNGSGSHNTWYRNWVVGESNGVASPPVSSGRWFGDFQQWNYSCNLVGNILGSTGHTGTQYAGDAYAGDPRFSYKIGFASPGSNNLIDSNVNTTLHNHRNYDYIGDAVSNEAGFDSTLDSSLYLSGKPSWFGSLSFPPVDPDAGTHTDIPAKARYEGTSYLQSGTLTTTTLTVGP